MKKSYPLFIIVLVFISFYPVLGSFFLADDAAWLVQAETAKQNFFEVFKPIRWGYFRPLTLSTVTLLYNVFFLSPIYYNIFSLTIHIINVFLFYIFLLNITKNQKLSILSSAIFSVSASHHQAVLWMADLGDLLSGFFLFSALYFYIRKESIFYFLSLLFYIFGLLSKEIVITFIVIIVVVDILFYKKIQIAYYLPFLIITIVYFFIYSKVTGFPESFSPIYKPGWHFAGNLTGVLFELFKSIGGKLYHPAFTYFSKNTPTIYFLLEFLNILLFVSAIGILFFAFKNIEYKTNTSLIKILLFSLFWTVIILFPLSFFVYMRELPGAFFARYRFFYLPSAGYALFVSSIIVFIYDVIKRKTFIIRFLFSMLIFSIILSNVFSNNLLSQEFKYRSKTQEKIVRDVGKRCINCNKIYLLGFPDGMHIIPYLQDFINLYYNSCCKVVFIKNIKEIKDVKNVSLLVLEDGVIKDRTYFIKK